MRFLPYIAVIAFMVPSYAAQGYAAPGTASQATLASSPHEAKSNRESSSIARESLQLLNVTAEQVTYLGRAAIRITDTGSPDLGDAGRLAVLRGSSFQDGVIEVDVSGDTAPNAPPSARGFVGVAFRLSAGNTSFECFYLRPKNGRSEDQLQRNHSAQYISMPGFPWQKLRAETPGEYESYVDLVSGQ